MFLFNLLTEGNGKEQGKPQPTPPYRQQQANTGHKHKLSSHFEWGPESQRDLQTQTQVFLI